MPGSATLEETPIDIGDCIDSQEKEIAIIIGAGPAGLTAAYELLTRTSITPIILEKSGDIGGISKTVNYKGNRMDMGPHRFFSKSDRVMDWWMKMMPLEQTGDDETLNISYQNKTREIPAGSATGTDKSGMMLIIERLTRIYFLRRFFNYPIQLSIDTLRKLGPIRTAKIMFSYLRARLFPIKNESSLQDFLINRFGRELYLTFFKDYTEKVWGISCEKISAEWGAQRIKGVSISKAIQHAVKAIIKSSGGKKEIGQKGTETSLIEQFLYPAKGAGQMWEEVARQVKEMGGQICHYEDVQKIWSAGNEITTVVTVNSESGLASSWKGNYFFSTMPVQELVAGMDEKKVPEDVKEVAAGLMYRDFVNVGVLLKKMSMPPEKLKDSWIYIQDKGVKVGRIQIYNNWGPYMVSDPTTTWIGLEYFCNKTDEFWKEPDDAIKQIAIRELEKIGLASAEDVLDITVQRMEKTYPAYFGTYDRFDVVKNYISSFGNLFLVGRNGMHKYNNTDHSMLTAMVAVDNVIAGVTSKENLWEINTEQEYHEEKETAPVATAPVEYKTFPSFVFKTPLHKRLLWASAFFLIAQFIIFKLMYPYPNFMPDSYSYIGAAMSNQDISTWPVGYSKFLRVFSSFTHSDMALVLFQYLFLEASIICFIFTLMYFLKPGRVVMYILFAFAVFNPLLLFMSNYVSADAMFTGLSLLWLSSLIGMLYTDSRALIWWHAVLLVVLFTVRHNALYYPVVSLLAFVLSKYSWRLRIMGFGLSLVLVGLFVWHTGNKYKELTGRRTISAFGGWQLAANALYMYSRMPADPNVPARFKELDRMVRKEFDSLNKVKVRPDSVLGIYYLWHGPLPRYLTESTKKDTVTPYFTRYAKMGHFYADYGEYLIKHHSTSFVTKYLIRNFINYYAPPVEFLGFYNMGADTVQAIAKGFFSYEKNTKKIASRPVKMFRYFPVGSAVINIAFIFSIIGVLIFIGLRDKVGVRFLLLIAVAWGANMFFSILASPIVLRYEVFAIVVIFSTCVVIGSRLREEMLIVSLNSN